MQYICIDTITICQKKITKWSLPGEDPGLTLGCCKIYKKKKYENRNDIIMQKNYRLSKKQEGMVLITVGVQI